jgi:hypothetical protein
MSSNSPGAPGLMIFHNEILRELTSEKIIEHGLYSLFFIFA